MRALHVLTMRCVFEDIDTEAVLFVDVSNTFNSLNQQAALRNAHILCPIPVPVLTNTHRCNAKLFIGGEHILSQEGTTQGDPLAMAMYAIGTLPLIQELQGVAPQSWYADNATAGGKLRSFRMWWDRLKMAGPHYGYHPNPAKTWHVVKFEHHEAAADVFRNIGINITEGGMRYLGSYLGSADSVKNFVQDKVVQWVKEMENLSIVAESQPQATYAIFTRCLVSRWNYITHTVLNISGLLQPLEDAIRCCFLPALTGRMILVTRRESCLHCLPDSGVLELLTQPSACNGGSMLLQGCQNLWRPLSSKGIAAIQKQSELNKSRPRLHFTCKIILRLRLMLRI